MYTVTVIEETDIVHPDDLVRDIYPSNWYSQSDLVHEDRSTYWQHAKFVIPAFIGKSTKELNEKLPHGRMSIIRFDKLLTIKEYLNYGFLVKLSNASWRHFTKKRLEDEGIPLGDLSLFPTDIVFTFGKYKDRNISQILDEDKYYLEWLVENHKDKQLVNIIKEWIE
jgi:hypothetical protein